LWVSKNNVIENIKVCGGKLYHFVHHIKIIHKINETESRIMGFINIEDDTQNVG
jgi:hypothetical protein